jgi:hypothetical protein
VAAVEGDPLPSWLVEASPNTDPEGGVVPAGFLVVCGDAERSEDSRQLGFISSDRRHIETVS